MTLSRRRGASSTVDELRSLRAVRTTFRPVCKYTQIPAPDDQANSRSRRGLDGAGAIRSWALPGGAEQGAKFSEPVALAIDVDDGHVMEQAVEDRRGQDLIASEDLGPVADMFVGGEQDRAAFVPRGHEAKEEIRFHAVQRAEADLVDDEQATIDVPPCA